MSQAATEQRQERKEARQETMRKESRRQEMQETRSQETQMVTSNRKKQTSKTQIQHEVPIPVKNYRSSR